MKVAYWSGGKIKDMTISEVLKYEVTNANSKRGALEDAECRIEKLTEILGVMAEMLPAGYQRMPVEQTCFYWRNPEVSKTLKNFFLENEHDH